MSAQPGGRNVYAMRTFAQDASRLRSTQKTDPKITPPSEEVVTEPVVQEKSPEISPLPNTSKPLPKPPLQKKSSHQENLSRLTRTAHAVDVPKKDSFSTDSSESFDIGSGEGGSIIRDTKRKRFKLFPAIVQASTEWFQGQKTAYTDYRHPHHAIENADARKEVIEAAVEKSAIAPKEDFHVVAKHLRGVERRPVTSTIILKDKTEVPKPQWSYVEEQAPQNDIVKIQEEPEPLQIQETEPATEAEEILATPLQETEAVAETAPEPKVADAPIPEPLPVTVQEETPKETYSPIPRQVSTPSYTEQQRFPGYLLISVIVGALFLGTAVSYFIFKDTDAPQEKAVVYKIPSLIQAHAQYAFTLPNDRTVLLSSLRETLNSNADVIQLYATHAQEDGSAKPASSEEILQILAPRTGGSFNRAITELTFGGVGTEPYIIMKVTSFDTAFAGMLDWEKTMSADLSPLFGTPVVTTFDPGARTDTQLRDAFFKDTITSNKNVRLLLDEEGSDRIIYTFINQNTVLITTTKEALETLVPLIK